MIMHAPARRAGPASIGRGTSWASPLSFERGRARKTDPNALTKQAAERALVSAKRARQMKIRTLKSGFATATEEKKEIKIRISLANPFRGGRAAIATAPIKKRADVYGIRCTSPPICSM